MPAALDRPAYRDPARPQQSIEGIDRIALERIAQVGFGIAHERSEPMPLTGPGKTAQPSARLYSVGDLRSDGLYEAVKFVEVALRLEPDHATAFRASVSSQVDEAGAFIEPGKHESVSPQPRAPALRASGGLRPWVVFAFKKNILECGDNGDYHDLVLLGRDASPVSGG